MKERLCKRCGQPLPHDGDGCPRYVNRKTCDRCGERLPHTGGKGCPKRPSRRQRPSRKVGPARSRRDEKKLARSMIWAIDTEETKTGETTVIVAANEHGDSFHLSDPEGLSSETLLDFLVGLPPGLKVSFFFNYDVTMILRDFRFAYLNTLREAGTVTTERWKIRHIPSKRFWAKSRLHDKSVQVWDVATWYPTSFNQLLKDFDLATPTEAAFIKRMKSLRVDFAKGVTDLTETTAYCKLECVLLARWVRQVITLHHAVGLNLSSYCGPGSTASAIYRKNGWRPPVRDEELTSVASEAFFGGRNEISAMGAVDSKVYVYDIGSAYPYEIANLPGIRAWRIYEKGEPTNPDWWGFAEVIWRVPDSAVWGPFPVRGAQLATGRSLSLVYPREGHGVFHSSEITAAREAYPDCIEVLRSWVAITTNEKPFAWVEALAAERLERKAAGDPAAYPLKVGLNSLYGKMVQRKGRAPYRDIVYGAAVTAGTRARLFRILARAGRDALLAATDGILLTKPIEGLDMGKNLGQWELDTYPSAFLAQSGVYWVGEKIRTRGFRRNSLTLAEVKTAWKEEKTDAVITYKERRFIGYRLATARGREDQLGTWAESVRSMYLSPYPRRVPFRWQGDLLYTNPPPLMDWMLTRELDTAFLSIGRRSDDIYQRVHDREDPSWIFEDVSP